MDIVEQSGSRQFSWLTIIMCQLLWATNSDNLLCSTKPNDQKCSTQFTYFRFTHSLDRSQFVLVFWKH